MIIQYSVLTTQCGLHTRRINFLVKPILSCPCMPLQEIQYDDVQGEIIITGHQQIRKFAMQVRHSHNINRFVFDLKWNVVILFACV